ncbi:MAG: MnhB domain-containing protein, partial [Corynebacterium sp.]|nr:MnhB domain-containing protein [Corynebacterium sp.]
DTMGELTVLGMAGVAIAAVVGSIPRQKFNPAIHPLKDANLNSMVMREVGKILMPLLGLLALLIFWRGHQSPGGGFIAALVASGAIVIYYLAKGEDARVGSPNLPYYLTGIGVLLAIADGLWGVITHGSYLYAMHGHALGQHWTSAMIFDAGVFLSVLGMITTALNTLGGRQRAGKEK